MSIDDFKPWSKKEVEDFLENRCGLSKENPIKGSVVIYHDEVFFEWRSLVKKELLVPPFDVVHVDAHADLGLGDSSWLHLMGEHLHKNPEDRCSPEQGVNKMNPGNYLSYAIACRWINSLKYVPNKKSGNDLMPFYFKGYSSSSNIIELKKCNMSILKKCSMEPSDKSFGVIEKEPEVQFERIPVAKYHDDGKFDYIFLCQSPGFTPIESDLLIPVIGEYIKKI